MELVATEHIKTTQEAQKHKGEGVGTCISVHVLEERLKALQERIAAVETAFPRTSVGTPAFDRHRDYHEEEELKEFRVKQIQHEITKKIVVVVFGALLSALVSGYSDDIFRALKQLPAYVREFKLKELKQEGVLNG